MTSLQIHIGQAAEELHHHFWTGQLQEHPNLELHRHTVVPVIWTLG